MSESIQSNLEATSSSINDYPNPSTVCWKVIFSRRGLSMSLLLYRKKYYGSCNTMYCVLSCWVQLYCSVLGSKPTLNVCSGLVIFQSNVSTIWNIIPSLEIAFNHFVASIWLKILSKQTRHLTLKANSNYGRCFNIGPPLPSLYHHPIHHSEVCGARIWLYIDHYHLYTL